MRNTLFYSMLAWALAVSAPSYGAIAYAEADTGDLSNSGLTPTAIALAVGSNQILGTTGSNPTLDRDYFTVNIPTGFQLATINLLPNTSTPAGTLSFIGLQAGSQVTLPTNTSTAAGLLGWKLYGISDINTDILSQMAIPANGSSGFTPPLAAGDYALWIQDSAAGAIAYGLELNVVPVPLPSAYGLFSASLAALGWIGRRRRPS